MSKIAQRIEEIERLTKKSRIINNVLWVIVFLLVALAAYFAYQTAKVNKQLESANTALEEKNELLIKQKDTISMQKLDLEKRNAEIEDYKNQLLNSVQSDEVYWEVATSQNTLESYIDYLKNHTPDNLNYLDAKKRLDDKLKAQGFVQIMESNGKSIFTQLLDLGEDGKYLICKNAVRVRRGVIGNKEYAPSTTTGEVIGMGQIVRVEIDSIPSGQSMWAKIRFSR